ncbi:MAG: YvcK family protein [Armatimonadota bacterium]|nr:MAG: YvcK family protein [Armatimonadota bacterium]
MSAASGLSVPSADEVRKEYGSRGQFDFVVPGGGHGAAAVCRALLEEGYAVAGVANPIDEGGHSARIRWDLYRHLGYWPIIPGDTMNLLGGGFAHPAIYSVTNSRLPKDLGDRPADVAFAEAVDAAIEKRPESDRAALEDFKSFLVEMGAAIQKELVEPGLASLPGASLQNILHVGVMVCAGAYRQGIPALDQERYLSGSYLLEREMKADRRGLVVPMSFDKVTLVTKHAGGRTVVGGINRVLLAKGGGPNGLEYGDMVPNSMLPDAPRESSEEEAKKLASAKVVDWYPAEVEHGPTTESFDNDWVFKELHPFTPRINPFLAEIVRSLKPGGSIVIPPGNAHESTYTFFIMSGLWEELRAAKLRGVRVTLVCNPVNLLLTAGYTVDDYLRAIEQGIARASGDAEIKIEQVIDRVVVNDPSTTSEKVQKMMQGEGIPLEVKRVLLHRTPTGPVTVTSDDIARLGGRSLEVIYKPMLSVETVSIRGIETEAISYEKEKLLESIA